MGVRRVPWALAAATVWYGVVSSVHTWPSAVSTGHLRLLPKARYTGPPGCKALPAKVAFAAAVLRACLLLVVVRSTG
jgi:hypothetical protein